MITFRRFALTSGSFPNWSKSKKTMAPMHVQSAKKIEEIDCTLQVNLHELDSRISDELSRRWISPMNTS